jgi:MFS family permease
VLGHRAEYVTFAWVMWELTHSAKHLGYLGLAQGVPLVVFQLMGGVLADRVNRLRLLIGTQILTALTLSLAFVLAILGLLRVDLLLALAALTNTFRAFDEPSRMSLVPQLVTRDRLPNAIALGGIPWQAGRVIGPSITGILIAAFGGEVGLGFAAAASCLALVLYSRLRLDSIRPSPDGQDPFQQLVEGLRFVAGNFVFAGLICLALFNAVFGLSYVTLLPIYADVYFGTGSTGYGALNAAHGIGALAGSLTMATLAYLIRRPGKALLAGATSLGLALMVFSQAPGMMRGAGADGGGVLQYVLPDAGEHLPPAAGARSAPRPRDEPLLPVLEPAAAGRLVAAMLAAAVDARFAVLVGGAMVAANALVLFGSRRLRAIA